MFNTKEGSIKKKREFNSLYFSVSLIHLSNGRTKVRPILTIKVTNIGKQIRRWTMILAYLKDTD